MTAPTPTPPRPPIDKPQPPAPLKANKGPGLDLIQHMERTLSLPPNWESFTVHVVARGAFTVQVSYMAEEKTP